MLFYDLLGYFSIVFSIFAFLSLEKNKARIHGIISTTMFGISIYGYNGFNGLFVSVISILSKFLSIFIEEKKLTFIKYSSPLLAFLFFFFFNEEGWVGIFPALSLIFIIFADMQEDILRMKQIYYGSAFCWLVYAIVLGSIPAILFDIFGIFTLAYSIHQIKISRSKEEI